MWNDLFVANIFQAGSCVSRRRGASNKVPFTGIKELSSGLGFFLFGWFF